MLHPAIGIRQTPGLIGLNIERGQFSIRQHNAEMAIETKPSRLEITQHSPQLTIDQSRAFAAYHGGHYTEVNNRIYSGVQQIFLQAIAHRVELGNRMAAIHQPGNTIGEIWGGDWQTSGVPEFRERASYDNVRLQYDSSPPEISFEAAQVNIEVNRRPPEIEYHRGAVEVYMRQHPGLEFTPPVVDLQL
ncbi:DUF6470 family protein [Paenibacillus sp. JSM ZJ436]|uniref:DUF6470 family protein n=1 Tax=Paenibacillus sp. JSM ZJ436 TaxID=3376190 RepID=UPI0037A235D3